MKYISNKFKVNPKTLLVGSIALLMSLSAYAQTHRWTGGGTNNDWGTTANWGTSPTFAHNRTVSFYQNTSRLTNFIGDSRTIGTLNFEARPADVTIRFATSTNLARQLIMSATNATQINVEAGASGNFTVGDGFGTLAFTSGDLNVVHNGTGNLLLNATTIGRSAFTWDTGLNLSGTGTLQIGGGANYTGNTQINGGTFQLLNGGSMAFEIGDSGVNTQIIAAAGTTASFDGEFVFYLEPFGDKISGHASTIVGSSWTIFTGAGSLSTGSNFAVRDFTPAGGGIWTKDIDGVNAFSFSESTGVLSVVPEPTTTVLFISLGVAVFAIFRRRKVA